MTLTQLSIIALALHGVAIGINIGGVMIARSTGWRWWHVSMIVMSLGFGGNAALRLWMAVS